MFMRRKFTRRKFLATSGMAMTAAITGLPRMADAATGPFHMPDEGEPHTRTWMAFGPTAGIWGAGLLPVVQADLGRVAARIADFEPVTMLVRPHQKALARKYSSAKVELLEAPHDDLWMRDTGPVFVKDTAGKLAGIDFNFNGWGEKQTHAQDAKVAGLVCKAAGVPRVQSELIMEGGGIEVDGHGTALLTESCILINNRNPGLTKKEAEDVLRHELGIKKFIWLPGVKGRDITDGHIDFYARFAGPGVVCAGLETDGNSPEYALTRRHLSILKAATDAQGRKLKIVTFDSPYDLRWRGPYDDFANGYINFYVGNGFVLATDFGDARTDGAAKEKYTSLFPGREIIMVPTDGIAAGGGGIHCATQQQPA